jgi:hypothetical protein
MFSLLQTFLSPVLSLLQTRPLLVETLLCEVLELTLWLGLLGAGNVDLRDFRGFGKFNLWYLWWLCTIELVHY